MTKQAAPETKFLRLANALTRSGYEDFLQTLVNELASILSVEYVLIAEVVEGENRAQTLAVSANGKSQVNFSYDLKGTPCETVSEREVCQYRRGVAEQFPEDHLLAELGVQSYVGIPVLTSDGCKLGLLSAMAQRPLELGDADQEILRIAAAQVGAELELSDRRRRIRSLTYEDPVTGLPNRRQLLDWLTDTKDAPALMLVDIKRFKDINDLYGHLIGDAILYAVAERLKSQLGDRGFLARLSSDEFVLVPHSDWPGSVEEQARDVRQWFEQAVIADGNSFHLGLTIGAATADQVPHTGVQTFGPELLRRAGVSLVEAKTRDLPLMLFEPGMVDSRKKRQELYEKLQLALRNNQLSLHYQPQIELDTGKLIGAEALCRWHDPDMGWISPERFIRLAEERGLINEIGDRVLQLACHQLQQWREEGHGIPGPLSVNISNRQLEEPDFASRLEGILGNQKPSSLLLELTETAMMRAPEINLRQMQHLNERGFQWAIDDFGTGYSSLAYLTRMSAGFLKIDRSFVSRVPGSEHDESVIRTIVAMAQSLDMEVIAEGIETEAQLAYLKSIGCRFGQGYLFDRPADAECFARQWLGKIKKTQPPPPQAHQPH